MESRGYRRPDQQWKCGLTDHAEACPLGPDRIGRCPRQQCKPQRTLSWWRSYLPIAFGTLTIAMVSWLAVTPRHREVIAPGPLSMAHAQLTRDSSDPHRCASCHDDSTNRFAKSVMDNNLVDAHTQTQRCIACHIRELPQLIRSSPHDLPLEQLQSMSASANGQTNLTVISDAITDMIPIATVNNDPKVPKSRTQSWLVRFTKDQSPVREHELACSDCHREHQGAEHDLQRISNERCQACHQNRFHAFANGHPEFSNYPASQVSRIAFDHIRHRDQHFSKSKSTFDCRVCHVNGAEQGRVGQVFRSVGFESACGSCHLSPMKSSFSDGIIVFQLPSLDVKALAEQGAELHDWPDAAGQILDGSVPPFMQALLMAEQEGQACFEKFPDSGKLSDFNIADSEHRQAILTLAAVSRKLLNQLAQAGQLEIQKRLLSALNTTDHGLVEQLMRGVPPDLFRQAYNEWFNPDMPVNSPSNALRVSTNSLSDLSSNDLLDQSLLTDEPSSLDAANITPNSTSSIDALDPSTWKPLKAAKHLTEGGWMIDNQRMAIVYVPSQHADPWLTAMLTLGSQLKAIEDPSISNKVDGDTRRWANEIAKGILAKESVGRCLECHLSVDSLSRNSEQPTQAGQLVAEPIHSYLQRWRADRFDARVRQLTRFDHGPHLLQSTLTDCLACHRTVRQEQHSTPSAFPSGNHDFEPMTVQDCASCHQPKGAGDHCTQCHNYHASGIEP